MESTSLAALTAVWWDVEPFLPLADTAALSGACRTMRRALVDRDAGKLRASHLVASSLLGHPLRYATELPRALGRVHFPSLRRAAYPPREGAGAGVGDDDGACDDASCFPTFVAGLSGALHLECLTLDARCVVRPLMEGGSRGDAILNSLRTMDLSRLGELREVTVVNNGVAGDGGADRDRHHSVDLMRALTPAIAASRGALRSLSVEVGGRPAIGGGGENEEHSAWKEFFVALFSATRLASLGLTLPDASPTEEGLRAARSETDGTGVERFRELAELRLTLRSGSDRVVRRGMDPCVFRSIVGSFSRCPSLRTVSLALPRNFWERDEGASALGALVYDKPELACLVCDFDHHRDDTGNVMRFISEFAAYCKRGNCKEGFHFSSIRGVDVMRLRELEELLGDNVELQCSSADDPVGWPIELANCTESLVNVRCIVFEPES